MTASPGNGIGLRHRNRNRLAVLFAAAIALAWGAAESPAQSPETPSAQEEPALEAPTPLLPFDPGPRQPEGAGPAADAPLVRGIEISPLEEIDPDSLGLLDDESGGLGAGLWAGVGRDRVLDLLALLPDRYHSAVLRDLARRLLLSRSEWPEASQGGARSAADLGAEPDLAMLVLRIDRLTALGDTDALERFLEIVPRRYDEEPIARARVESAMLLGEVADGCDEVHKSLPLYYSLPYWQKALIGCQLLAGESEKAQLGLGLLKERGLDEDAGFLLLARTLSGEETNVPAAIAAQPLPFALLRAAGQPLPPGVEEEAGLGVLVAMARSAETELEQRAAAAETAVALGALDPAELARIYGAFSVGLAELGGPARPDITTPRGRALAYQRAARAATPAAQAAALGATLDAAWASDIPFTPLAAVLQPMVSRLPRAELTLPQAAAAGRALYAAGRPEEASAWLAFAQQRAATRSEAATAASALWPYWRIAGGRASVPGDGIVSWQANQPSDDPAALGRRTALLETALQALDGRLPRGEATRATPALAQLAGGAAAGTRSAELAAAASEGRRGETLLLALAAMGGEPLARVSPETLGAVLAGLSDVGFETEARALALEAALAARI